MGRFRKWCPSGILHDLPKRGDELQKIARFGKDRTGALGKSHLLILRPGIRKKKHHRNRPAAFAELQGLVQFQSGVPRHFDIQQQDVRSSPKGQLGRRIGIVGGNHPESVGAQVGCELIRHPRIIVHDEKGGKPALGFGNFLRAWRSRPGSHRSRWYEARIRTMSRRKR